MAVINEHSVRIDQKTWLALSAILITSLLLVARRFWSAQEKPRPKKGATTPSTMNAFNEQDLVNEARKLLVASGDAEKDVARAMQALSVLVSAVRLKDGDDAAAALLERGREMFKEREGSDLERDQALESFGKDECLLKERGAESILEAAFVNGSSVLCRKCSGLVSRERWQAHKTQWCPALKNDCLFDEFNEDEEYEDDRMEVD